MPQELAHLVPTGEIVAHHDSASMAVLPMSWFAYDFGYSWPLTLGHLLIFATAAVVAALLYWKRWCKWAVATGFIAVWGLAGATAMHHAVRINQPQPLATEAFLPHGGRVLDLGAGSGRATVGLLLARPLAQVVAVDRYRGYYGIDDNTPARLQENARRAGVADRVLVEVADMRELPFAAGEFDAAMSVAALDHLRWNGIEQTLRETARVLKPRGQLLIVSINVDGWVRVAMPWSMHGHTWGSIQNRAPWRRALDQAGFDTTEVWTQPAYLYQLATRR